MVRYGPLEVAQGAALTWEVKIGAKTVEMAVARAVARPLAVKPGLVRFAWDSGQTPTAPFYHRPGELGRVGLPCLLHAADCGSALLTCGDRSLTVDGSVSGASKSYANGPSGRLPRGNSAILALRPRADSPSGKIRRPSRTRRRWPRTCRCPRTSNRPARREDVVSAVREAIRATQGDSPIFAETKIGTVPRRARGVEGFQRPQWPSPCRDKVSGAEVMISELNGWPACALVNASPVMLP